MNKDTEIKMIFAFGVNELKVTLKHKGITYSGCITEIGDEE